jgi:hypothetical protein
VSVMEKGKGSGREMGCLGAGSVCVEKKVGTRKNSKTREIRSLYTKVFDEKANTRGKREPSERFGCFGNGRVVW